MERQENRRRETSAGKSEGLGMPAWLLLVLFVVGWGAFWFSPQLIALVRGWPGG